jgi:hypothetical protein
LPYLLVDHLLGIGRENEMDLMPALSEVMEEPLEIDGAAGSGGGEDKTHREKATG